MHVNAKRMAISGMLLALTVICMMLSSILESNTLFLLAAASYFVGIIIREMGMKTFLSAAAETAGETPLLSLPITMAIEEVEGIWSGVSAV